MSFENIIGQHVAVKAIKNIIATNQVRGSYLFLGPEGVGRSTVALEVAKVLNCETQMQQATCSCPSCRKISSGTHPDVFIIEPEDASYSIKIEKVRTIIYEASLKPYEGRFRVFIIKEAEYMTMEAQNALLKLLEESPEHHIFILTLSNIDGVPPTVVSRCRMVKFNFLSKETIQEILKARGFNEEECILFSHMSLGSIGRAIEFKERDLIAHRDSVVNDFFLRKSAIFKENILQQYVNEDIEESLSMLLGWYRDIFISKFVDDPEKLLNIDRFREISSYKHRFGEKTLERQVLAIMDTMDAVRRNVNPKMAVFNLAVELKKD